MASSLVTATGMNRPGTDDADDVNGAVNWPLRYRKDAAGSRGQLSRMFLGVQIQCAQCHDHKTEKWKQGDFQRFAAAFAPDVGRSRPARTAKRACGASSSSTSERSRHARREERRARARSRSATPTALDGTDFSSSGEPPRKALATLDDAARQSVVRERLVNRTLGALPRTRLRRARRRLPRRRTRRSMPELLDTLADDFVAHGYDLKHLIRTICATEAYQLAARRPVEAADGETRSGRASPRGRSAPRSSCARIIDAATDLEPVLERCRRRPNVEKLQLQLAQAVRVPLRRRRETTRPTLRGTVPQALLLLNGRS